MTQGQRFDRIERDMALLKSRVEKQGRILEAVTVEGRLRLVDDLAAEIWGAAPERPRKGGAGAVLRRVR